MKNILGCLIFGLSMGSNVSLFASQNDFYGTWVGNIDINGIGVAEINIDISLSNLIMEFEFMIFNEIISAKENIEIVSWIESINSNNNDFPNGYTLSIKTINGHISILEIYISSDKRHIIISSLPSTNNNIARIMNLKRK